LTNFEANAKQNEVKINRFSEELPADADETNVTRQVKNAFSYVTPQIPSNPKVVHFSEEVAALLVFPSKTQNPMNSQTYFQERTITPFPSVFDELRRTSIWNWAGQLGDGRAIIPAEIENKEQVYTLQLKGAGMTPYSRRADGLAVLRSSIREHLCSEAMYHLGVPTTRSLSLILTGDQVLRDVMYDGNPAYEKAPSFAG
jgi:uncharacterized protein YdiU (UPF0061 family)